MISILLQVPLQKVNGVESLSGRYCYGTWGLLLSGCSREINFFDLQM
jgi:hypothetical protein